MQLSGSCSAAFSLAARAGRRRLKSGATRPKEDQLGIVGVGTMKTATGSNFTPEALSRTAHKKPDLLIVVEAGGANGVGRGKGGGRLKGVWVFRPEKATERGIGAHVKDMSQTHACQTKGG